MIKDIKSILLVRRLYRTRWFWTIRNAVRDLIPRGPVSFPIMDDRQALDVAEQILLPWPNNCAKPRVGLVQDRKNPPYWTKYERFLRNNQIPYEYYDIHQSDWHSNSKQFDIIIWASEGGAPDIEEQKRKTFALEKFCGKNCFPSFETLMWSDDKIYQYEWLKMFDFPVIETFISHSASEALAKIKLFDYPLVTKVPIGAGSLGVELVKNSREAKTIIRQAFSPVGRSIYWPYFRQKDYVYFQKFIPNASYDLRVIAVGNKVFGYYRDVPQGEFRASGMGMIRKGTLPEDAIHLAMQVIKRLDLEIAAVDMLRDSDGNLHIIEMSPLIQVDTAGQLHVDEVPGAYVFNFSGTYTFEPGMFWIQELALKEFFKRWLLKQRDSQSAFSEKL
jgi:glutathione synthase/RimK-type ligase-like ATP-grasp enzyme